MNHHHHSYSLSLRFILALSACFVISFCKPTVFNTEETKMELEAKPLSREIDHARKMWSDAKREYRNMQRTFDKPIARTRRDTNENADLSFAGELANITGGKYILDLYRNITNGTRHKRTQANIIKSLTFVKKNSVENCDDEFNFTLAAVNSSEFILQSKLRLYLRPNPPLPSPPVYIMEIKAKLSNGDLTEAAIVKEITPTEDGYIEFEVSDLVRHLISKESHAVFKVRVYKIVKNLESMMYIKCGEELIFVNSDMEEEMMPVLLVYAYNQKLEHIDYEKMAERTRQVHGTPQENSSISQTRRKRAISTGCGVLPLQVNRLEIAPDMFGMGSSFTVYLPHEYNAGICGGACHGKLPSNSPSEHASFIHILLDISSFRNRHGYAFNQCCAPVKYEPLEVLGSADGARLVIAYIPNMIISACDCIDIAV